MNKMQCNSQVVSAHRATPASHTARNIVVILSLLLALPMFAGQFGGQIGTGPQNPLQQNPMKPGRGSQLPSDDSTFGDQDPVLQAKRQKMYNADRQKSMVSDTNKLLKLAAEFNDEVKSKNPDALNSAELRKLADIEKLAHKVKENMSVPAQGGPMYSEPPLIPPPPQHH